MKVFYPIFFLVLAGSMLFSCQSKKPKSDKADDGIFEVKAEDVIQTSQYTYVLASADGKEFWLAIAKQEVEKGKTYYYSKAVEMKDFPSKELKRSFETILFVDDFSDQRVDKNKMPAGIPKGRQPMKQKEGISVEKAAGGKTIAEVYAQKAGLDGEKVIVRGQVVKYSADIMKKNWIHIQDGTKDGENYDLTITTLEVVQVGDVITIEGKVALDKDFGAGYFYELIVEDAKVIQP